MKLILLLLIIVTALGLFETLRHWRTRRRIPIRIHVNGSRGKSSVTRLIAAGLQAGGIRTFAKTTGSAARVIHPDGRETPVRRRGAPNIREQLRIFRRAADEEAQAIVLECMAVRPDLQYVCEHRIVRATHGVITNVRPDHLEAMGPRMEDVAHSLAGTVPRKAKLFTTEDRYGKILANRARALKSSYQPVDVARVKYEDLEGFPYVEFADNVGLALAVCSDLGVSENEALAGMQKVKPDVGALIPRRIREEGKEVTFVNLFAANDPESTAFVWDHLRLGEKTDEVLALINIRADRMRRSRDLAPLFGKRLRARRYLLIGEQTDIFGEILRREGVERARIVDLGGRGAAEIWKGILALVEERATLVGLGNIGGAGMALLDLMDGKELEAAQ
jgi:poly-gamma-glutamate synthase PgsB/CapB